MFHFPTFPPHALCVQARVTPHDWCGVPPFGNPRINARLTAPRGLSQPPTSFIGSWCPGIHRVPLTTWPHNYNKPHPPPPHRCPAHPHFRARTPATPRRCWTGLQSKMLASTVQFSKNERPPTHTHHQHPTPEGVQLVWRASEPRTQDSQPDPGNPGQVRSLRTQQRAYEQPTCTTRVPTHTPLKGRTPVTGYRAVLAASSSRRIELVSVPPSSSTPHTRTTPQMGSRPGVGVALDHPNTWGGQCSLERR